MTILLDGRDDQSWHLEGMVPKCKPSGAVRGGRKEIMGQMFSFGDLSSKEN